MEKEQTSCHYALEMLSDIASYIFLYKDINTVLKQKLLEFNNLTEAGNSYLIVYDVDNMKMHYEVTCKDSFMTEKDRQNILHLILENLKTSKHNMDNHIMVTFNGSFLYCYFKIIPLYGSNAVVLVIFQFQTEALSKEKEELIKSFFISSVILIVMQAYVINESYLQQCFFDVFAKDKLTGLHDEHYLDVMLQIKIQKAEALNIYDTFAFAIIDVTNLYYINTAYGYSTGDAVIQNVAKILQEYARPGDIIVRLSDGKFGIIFNNLTLKSAKFIVEQIKEKVSGKPHIANGYQLYISITASIAGCKAENLCTKDTVKENAYKGLQKAKRQGKGSVVIADVINKQETKRTDRYVLLVQSITEDMIEPAFQPIIDLQNANNLYGFEALCRIKYRDSIIAPGDFIEEAEYFGIINQIDLIMIEKACKKIIQMNQKYNTQYKLFLNINARAFNDEFFIKNFMSVISLYSKKQEPFIFIEITERDKLNDISALQDLKYQLKYHNINLVVDDFGSGFSSFSYIKQFEPSVIKIDGEFIREIENSEQDVAIVRSIKMIADAFQTKTLAEFVESERQLHILRELGINYGQGYLLGKPVFELENFIINNGQSCL